MITPSFSPTATERVLPKLALDFTTASLDPRVTFTRTTGASNPATYVNSSGNITAATNNQPRFDYDPINLSCKGLLIEESRTNLCLYSEQFNNAAWTTSASNVTVTPDAAISPSGLQNADALVENSTNGFHYITQAFTKAASAIQYTFTCYVKPSIRNWFFITVFDGTLGNRLWFNLSGNGSIGTNLLISTGFTNVSYSINLSSNGYYRCVVTFTTSTGTNLYIYPSLSTDDNVRQYAGTNGAIGAYIWGAQLEAGAFATSYIPTTTTALTRNADVATMTGTNFSDWWTATNGASDIWLTPKSTSTLAYMSFDDNTANNKIIIANNTTSGQSTITSGGTLQATLTAGTITANATNKVGCSWNTNNCAATANATTPATTASATIPTVTQLRIGNNGTAYANAWIQKLFYWSQRITNNEIQAFTK